MDLVTLPSIAQDFLDRYVQGEPDARGIFVPSGIRHRFPSTVGIPPEYTPTSPNNFDGQTFAANTGPEMFDQPYLYLDRCALQRAIVSASATELHVQFLFVARWPPQNFDPNIAANVCLPTSAGEPEAIVSECINRLCDFLGTDGNLVGTAQDPIFPAISSEIQLLTLSEFQSLGGN
jgi:hypothetical protein